MEVYLARCRDLLIRIEDSMEGLSAEKELRKSPHWEKLLEYRAYALKFIDQVDRRLLKGEIIPQEENYSLTRLTFTTNFPEYQILGH